MWDVEQPLALPGSAKYYKKYTMVKCNGKVQFESFNFKPKAPSEGKSPHRSSRPPDQLQTPPQESWTQTHTPALET